MAARVTFGGRDVACTVRNLSDTGAKLELASGLRQVPAEFTLLLPDGHARDCRVVWRTQMDVGVEFTPASSPEGTPA